MPHASAAQSNPCSLYRQLRSLGHRLAYGVLDPALGQDLSTFLDVCSFQAQDKRQRDIQISCRRYNGRRQHIHPQNATKDIDEDALYVRVRQQDRERRLDLLLVRPTPNIQEVRRLPPA